MTKTISTTDFGRVKYSSNAPESTGPVLLLQIEINYKSVATLLRGTSLKTALIKIGSLRQTITFCEVMELQIDLLWFLYQCYIFPKFWDAGAVIGCYLV